jgi:hypothetical protein
MKNEKELLDEIKALKEENDELSKKALDYDKEIQRLKALNKEAEKFRDKVKYEYEMIHDYKKQYNKLLVNAIVQKNSFLRRIKKIK